MGIVHRVAVLVVDFFPFDRLLTPHLGQQAAGLVPIGTIPPLLWLGVVRVVLTPVVAFPLLHADNAIVNASGAGSVIWV